MSASPNDDGVGEGNTQIDGLGGERKFLDEYLVFVRRNGSVDNQFTLHDFTVYSKDQDDHCIESLHDVLLPDRRKLQYYLDGLLRWSGSSIRLTGVKFDNVHIDGLAAFEDETPCSVSCKNTISVSTTVSSTLGYAYHLNELPQAQYQKSMHDFL